MKTPLLKSFLFIINPIPVYYKKFDEQLVRKYMPKDYQLVFRKTEYHKHAVELAKQGVQEKFDVIVAVGGDGTVHEVAQALVNTEVKLGIIKTSYSPAFHNYFEFPKQIKQSLDILLSEKVKKIDLIEIANEELKKVYAVCYLGLGISSRVVENVPLESHKTFFVIWGALIKAFRQKAEEVTLKFHYEEITITPFELLIANINQYPAHLNFFLSANPFDGVMDIMISKNKSLARYLLFIFSRLFKVEDKISESIEFHKCSSLVANFSAKTAIQIDNEPYKIKGETEINVLPKALKLIVP